MARSNSTASHYTAWGGWKFAGAAGAAIVGGIGIGYLFGGARATRPPQQPVPPSATVLAPPSAPAVSPSSIRPHSVNGDYVAPNAPRITIREERTPVLRRTAPLTSDAAPADTEASQEAVPTPKTGRRPRTTPADSSTPAPLDTNPDTTPAAVNAGPAAPETGTTAPSAAPPAAPDPDFEQVAPRGTSPSGTNSGTGGSATHAQFRVQTGAYADEGNARSIADQLRGQGYATSTRSEREGDHLVYKVQVGAYRSKSGASKAADDLQKKGVSVYVSPIGQ